jgi:putative transposase
MGNRKRINKRENGFDAFTVSQFHVPLIINYIKNQEEHHKISSFKEEYINFLETNEIEYKPEYIFIDE